MTKRCVGKCKQVKDFNLFGKDSSQKDSKNARCKECNKELSASWYESNANKVKADTKAKLVANPTAYKKNKHKIYKKNHLKKYGLTPEQYQDMLRAQNHVCAICHKTETAKDPRNGKLRDLAVDHCHKTGKVRSLLCGKCNRVLGVIDDNLENLAKISKYLVEHS